MLQFSVNYWAILVCGFIFMAVGALWYSPVFFGKQWMKMMGIDMHNKEQMAKMKKEAGSAYAGSFASSLVMAYVLAHFVQYTMTKTPATGMVTAFWLWLGFVATTSFTNLLYGKKPYKLWMIDSGFHLVTMVLFGAVLASWV